VLEAEEAEEGDESDDCRHGNKFDHRPAQEGSSARFPYHNFPLRGPSSTEGKQLGSPVSELHSSKEWRKAGQEWDDYYARVSAALKRCCEDAKSRAFAMRASQSSLRLRPIHTLTTHQKSKSSLLLLDVASASSFARTTSSQPRLRQIPKSQLTLPKGPWCIEYLLQQDALFHI
jgi:hypothetical protein